MRISDWSSDVCSSDLRSLSTRRVGTVHQRIVRWCLAVKDLQTDVALPVTQQAAHEIAHAEGAVDIAAQLAAALFHIGRRNGPVDRQIDQESRLDGPVGLLDKRNSSIGSTSCRERVCQYVC